MELKPKYYSATQAARLLKVPPHVLRYWERKFEFKPARNSAGRRVYSQEQVDKMARIKFLRYEEKLTVRGARKKLSTLARMDHEKPRKSETRDVLLWLKKELIELRDMLTPDP
jgi:DNA-binding transcriptional MerR regulator